MTANEDQSKQACTFLTCSTYFCFDCVELVQNFLQALVFASDLDFFFFKKKMNQFSHFCKMIASRKKGGATDLQEDPHHGEPVGLTGRLAEAGVFGVPVHQVELPHTNRRNPITNDLLVALTLPETLRRVCGRFATSAGNIFPSTVCSEPLSSEAPQWKWNCLSL